MENSCLSKQASDGEEGRQDGRVTQLENERDQLVGECHKFKMLYEGVL